MRPRINIFKQIAYAITKPKKYPVMAQLGAGRIFLYLLILSIFSTICIFTPPIITYFKLGGVERIADSYIPEFSFNSDTLLTDVKIQSSFDFDSFIEIYEDDLSIDEIYDDDLIETFNTLTIYSLIKSFSQLDIDNMYSEAELTEYQEELIDELQNESFYLFVDTSYSSVGELIYSNDFNLEEITEDNLAILTRSDYAFLSKKEIKAAIETNELTTYTYENADEFEISKDDIMQLIKTIIPVIYIIVAVIIIFFIFFQIIGWLISSLIFAVLAMIANLLTHKNYKFGSLFIVSIYAHTASIILSALLNFGPDFPTIISSLIGWILPIVYIVLVILNNDDTSFEKPAVQGMYDYFNSPNNYYNVNNYDNTANNNTNFTNQNNSNNINYTNQNDVNNSNFANQNNVSNSDFTNDNDSPEDTENLSDNE